MPNDFRHNGELTIEDMQTLERCRDEAFWYRVVPLSLGYLSGIHYLIRTKGYFPTIGGKIGIGICALISSHFIGKFSYLGKCKQMFLELDNSLIKDRLIGGNMAEAFGGPIILDLDRFGAQNSLNNKSMSYSERRKQYKKPNTTEESPSKDQNDFRSDETQQPYNDEFSDRFSEERPNSFVSDDFPRGSSY
ncbi:hypothetical protein Ciccas_008035 [Cichlidogyrus casuarinus]|uniref:OCIA domain-containing protein n=1 Tax=Cichlidogyrus casuarinus TaxID=1844966 RepID=A0ABD2Q156_9PLAT